MFDRDPLSRQLSEMGLTDGRSSGPVCGFCNRRPGIQEMPAKLTVRTYMDAGRQVEEVVVVPRCGRCWLTHLALTGLAFVLGFLPAIGLLALIALALRGMGDAVHSVPEPVGLLVSGLLVLAAFFVGGLLGLRIRRLLGGLVTWTISEDAMIEHVRELRGLK